MNSPSMFWHSIIVSRFGNLFFSPLLQTSTPPPNAQIPRSFWQANQNEILVGFIMLLIGVVVTLFISDPLKALLGEVGKRLEAGLESLGFGYRRRYLRHLVEAHRWLKLIGQRRGLERPQLEDVYISLQLRASAAKEAPRFDWRRLFVGEEKHLVVLGHPGAGKSTLLDYLVLVFSGQATKEAAFWQKLKRPTALFVRLREVGAGEKKSSLMELLTSPIAKTPNGYFERLLRQGKCIVLLDGLDEVLARKLHTRVVEEIKTLVQEYPENWYIVTCRVAGWRGQLPGFRVYNILEFGPDDIRRFASAWYREVLHIQAVNALGPAPKAEVKRAAEQKAFQIAQERAENLWQALQDNPGLLQIASTPLILSLIALVHNDRETRLPKGRARLYMRCLDILLEEWELQDKQLELGAEHPSPQDKLLALKHVAFHFLENSLLEMERVDLEAVLSEPVARFSVKTNPEDFIATIHERSGILVEVAYQRYGFAHRALQDYLAAQHIADKGLDNLLLKNVAHEEWREVILIAVGLLADERRMTAVVRQLYEQGRTDSHSLLVAGRCLAEDVQIEPALRGEIIRGLLDTRADFSPEYLERIVILMSIDTNIAKELLLGIGGETQFIRNVRQSLLDGLGRLSPARKHSFVMLFLPVLAEPSSPAWQREYATQALGCLSVEDPIIWATLKKARDDDDLSVRAAATWAYCALGRYAELGLVKVPAGEFIIGEGSEQHPLYLPTFYIHKYPVTVENWRFFVEESGHQPQFKESLQGIPDHPVRFVTWHEAIKYAQWYGMSLPSEAEWEKAARGTDGRMFPWGNEWQPGLANTAEYWERSRNWLGRFLPSGSSRKTTPVGQFSPRGDSLYGCADVVGNVREWTRSIYEKYPYHTTDGRENLEALREIRRVLRGGSFNLESNIAWCAARDWNYPVGWDWDIGFRVVVSPSS